MTTLTRAQVIASLQQSGWISEVAPEGMPTNYSPEQLAEFISQYQAFHGLKPDGVVGPATSALMSAPRCALKDQIAKASLCRWPQKRVTFASRLAFGSLSEADCNRAFAEACADWNAVCGINLQDGVFSSANIYANPGRIDGPSQVLAYSYLPCNASETTRLEQVYDTAERWTFEFLKRTILHEVGHAIGLNHLASGNIMAPILNTSLPGLQPGDIREAVLRYGKPDLNTPVPVPPTEPPTGGGGLTITGALWITAGGTSEQYTLTKVS